MAAEGFFVFFFELGHLPPCFGKWQTARYACLCCYFCNNKCFRNVAFCCILSTNFGNSDVCRNMCAYVANNQCKSNKLFITVNFLGSKQANYSQNAVLRFLHSAFLKSRYLTGLLLWNYVSRFLQYKFADLAWFLLNFTFAFCYSCVRASVLFPIRALKSLKLLNKVAAEKRFITECE